MRATEQDMKIKQLENELASKADELKSLRRKYAIWKATLKQKLEEVRVNPQHHLEQNGNQRVARPSKNHDQQQTMPRELDSENRVQEQTEVSPAVQGIIGNTRTCFGAQGSTVTVWKWPTFRCHLWL